MQIIRKWSIWLFENRITYRAGDFPREIPWLKTHVVLVEKEKWLMQIFAYTIQYLDYISLTIAGFIVVVTAAVAHFRVRHCHTRPSPPSSCPHAGSAICKCHLNRNSPGAPHV